jgi:hypothetical protein
VVRWPAVVRVSSVAECQEGGEVYGTIQQMGTVSMPQTKTRRSETPQVDHVSSTYMGISSLGETCCRDIDFLSKVYFSLPAQCTGIVVVYIYSELEVLGWDGVGNRVRSIYRTIRTCVHICSLGYITLFHITLLR